MEGSSSPSSSLTCKLSAAEACNSLSPGSTGSVINPVPDVPEISSSSLEQASKEESEESSKEDITSPHVASSLVFDHVKGWYTHQNELNILFLCYEEMIQDLRGAVLKICKFIGKELSSQEVDKVVEMSTFKNMKADPRANFVNTYEECFGLTRVKHIRKGTVGDWKNIMTVSQSERFDNIFQAQMKDIALKFIWDIKEIQSTQHGKLEEPLQEDRGQKCSTQL